MESSSYGPRLESEPRITAFTLLSKYTECQNTSIRSEQFFYSNAMAHANMSGSPKIEQLTKENYDSWSVQVKALMVKKRYVDVRMQRENETKCDFG